MVPFRVVGWSLLAVALFSLASCAAPEHDSRAVLKEMPTDFALEVYVAGNDDPASVAAVRSAHYVVEPNRRYRVSAGKRAGERHFPRVVRVLRPWEYEDLFARTKAGSLMENTGSDAGRKIAAGLGSPGEVGYEVLITAYGKTHRFSTTPAESPETEAFVTRLSELISGAPGTVLR